MEVRSIYVWKMDTTGHIWFTTIEKIALILLRQEPASLNFLNLRVWKRKLAASLFSAKYLGFDTLSFSYPKEETWLFRKQIINVWIDLQYMHKICSNRIHTWRELIISFSLLDKNIWFRQVLLTCYLQSEITLYTEKRKPQTHGKHLPNK